MSFSSGSTPRWLGPGLLPTRLEGGAPALRLLDLAPQAFTPPENRRDRLWELSPNLHCSIVGTCLTTADLRGLMSKLGLPPSSSEHELHAQAVSRAARKDDGGKLLHKLLDRRHAREIRLFTKAGTADEVRALWAAALEKGEIPGAYWAAMTHPCTDRDLVKDVFGEVHMLSHLVGRAVRADLRRFADLEERIAAHDDLVAEQAARIAALTNEKSALAQRLADRTRRAACPSRPDQAEFSEVVARLEDQLARATERAGQAEAHARAERSRREEAEGSLRALAEDIRAGAAREASLGEQIAELEGILADGAPGDDPRRLPALRGLTLLYVGGRPRAVAEARRWVVRAGGELLSHDGGVEDSPAVLPGLVGQADAVLFPVDFVSHDAVGTLKRCCRERAIPFLPLRSAGFAALLVAIRSIEDGKRARQAG